VFEAAADPEGVPGLGAAAIKAFHRFMATMRVLRERAEGGAGVAELLEETLRETGYLEALEAERTIEAQGRIENLEELIEVAREYDATVEGGEERSLDGFLQQIALLSDQDVLADEEGLVTLMSLHNAKGLEFPIVFMIGCEEGVFPHSRALDEGGLEEERRLCYVGITRAERDLYMTYARTRNVFGSRTYGLRNRFLDEIPGELTDEDSAPAAARGAWRERATSWSGTEADAPAPPAFRMGEDIVHAAFGAGVVTGVEPDGIVVVRFADDGSERKLMAAHAPITRR
jgi:DNA helicase-2/ATP-dependent DNA helicase PcrA